MNNLRQKIKWLCLSMFLAGLSLLLIDTACFSEDDHWQKLRETMDSVSEEKIDISSEEAKEDPWAKLRAIYLPFSQEDETAAATDKTASKKVALGIHEKLMPFESIIKKASEEFNVPIEIISGVIMVESGGNPNAKAKTSSASGLMQTISATFNDARSALQKQGIPITESPFDPQSSIMAGTWYLSHMFQLAKTDWPKDLINRGDIDSWKYPLQYYYAGPGHGAKRAQVVIIYSNGKKIMVDKPAYSNKVLKWAKILRAA